MEERMMERARAMLDGAAWERATEAGEAMTLEEAVEFALAQAELGSS
jgi:hypothetical protein